jgi:hypothetical protein
MSGLFGGGGGGVAGDLAPPPPPPPPWADLGVNTERGYNTLMATRGKSPSENAIAYNDLLGQGFNNQQIRSSAETAIGKQGDEYWNQMVQAAGLQSHTGRPMTGSAQFYQPIQQQQYTNYATTNPLSVSQYGTPITPRSMVDSAYAGVGRYGSGSEMNQVDQGGRQYWENQLASGSLTPQNFFNTFNNVINQARQDQSNPAYSQFLQNQTGYSGADFGGGYAQQPLPQMQTPFNPYTNQYQSPFSYQQPQYPQQQSNRFIDPDTGRYTGLADPPQMQTPFGYQQTMQQPAAQPNYGSNQDIVDASSDGIVSLLDSSK